MIILIAVCFRTRSYMEITATFAFFFDTIIFVDMSANPTFTMCAHTNRIILLDITKTQSILVMSDINHS